MHKRNEHTQTKKKRYNGEKKAAKKGWVALTGSRLNDKKEARGVEGFSLRASRGGEGVCAEERMSL